MATIELAFGGTHDRAAPDEPDSTAICQYHAAMAAEFLFAANGGNPVHIIATPKPRVILNRGDRPVRYVKRKPHDNSEYAK